MQKNGHNNMECRIMQFKSMEVNGLQKRERVRKNTVKSTRHRLHNIYINKYI